ncbi:MAG TPA: hemerythrin domain-containing protein [Gemmataceae bacterium]|nr:hemerythrin domain-containing protein [Gemmataceae bacterium]
MKTETPVSALSKAHSVLLRDLRGLGRFVQPEAYASIAELRSRLATTHTDVCEHFRLEEQGGYMDNMQMREPRLERTIAKLAAEHQELREALEEIRNEAAAARDIDDVLRYKVRTWIDRLLQHEQHENDVVQDAVDSDFGAAD